MITLARPPVNALNGDLVRKLIAAVEGARRDAGALVIAGQPGLFSAGLDVPGLLALDREGADRPVRRSVARAACDRHLTRADRVRDHRPLSGRRYGARHQRRLPRMAQGEFRLGLNEVQVGLFPGGPIHGAFKRLVGGHAAQLLTRGALIDPATALRMGLVDELCDAAQRDDARARSRARTVRIAARTHAAHARDGAARPDRSLRHSG